MSDESLRRGLEDSAVGRTTDLGDFTQYAHSTWVDEDTDHEGDPMWSAVCETCSWSSRWVHRDEFVHLLNGTPYPEGFDADVEPTDTDEVTPPDDQAYGHAKELGHQHEEEA